MSIRSLIIPPSPLISYLASNALYCYGAGSRQALQYYSIVVYHSVWIAWGVILTGPSIVLYRIVVVV